jgi:predicted thioesterase
MIVQSGLRAGLPVHRDQGRLGSGQVPVLATPRVLALAERATVASVAGDLVEGATTVGTRVELDHLAPGPVAADLVIDAMLERFAGRRLSSPRACATATGRWPAAASPGRPRTPSYVVGVRLDV